MTMYVSKNKDTGVKTLVEADNRSKAFRLAGEALIEIEVAKADEAVRLMEANVKVLRATDPQAELAPD